MIIIIGILAAIAIPMYLNQRDQAKNAVVKSGTYHIKLGVLSWAIDNRDSYPDVVDRTEAATQLDGTDGPSIGDYVDDWPEAVRSHVHGRRPWCGRLHVPSDRRRDQLPAGGPHVERGLAHHTMTTGLR